MPKNYCKSNLEFIDFSEQSKKIVIFIKLSKTVSYVLSLKRKNERGLTPLCFFYITMREVDIQIQQSIQIFKYNKYLYPTLPNIQIQQKSK